MFLSYLIEISLLRLLLAATVPESQRCILRDSFIGLPATSRSHGEPPSRTRHPGQGGCGVRSVASAWQPVQHPSPLSGPRGCPEHAAGGPDASVRQTLRLSGRARYCTH